MADSDDERDIMECDDRRFKAMVRDVRHETVTPLASSTFCHGSSSRFPNGPPSLVAGLLTFPFAGEARVA
jgi:hypothetical protein